MDVAIPTQLQNFPITDQLQQMVDRECHDQTKDRAGSIVLSYTPVHKMYPPYVYEDSTPIDVCAYFNGKKTFSTKRLTFSTTEEKIPLSTVSTYWKSDPKSYPSCSDSIV